MKDRHDWARALDNHFDQAAQGPGGRKGAAYDRILKTDTLFGDIEYAANQKGHEIIGYDALYQLGYNRFRVENVLRAKPLWKCPLGHEYHKGVGKVNESIVANKEICPMCARAEGLRHNTMTEIARLRLYMQHDERGEEMMLDTYANSLSNHYYFDRLNPSGAYAIRAQNVYMWGRQQYMGASQVVWIAEDGTYAFLWYGPQPLVENPFLKKFLEAAGTNIEPFYEPEYREKRGYRGRKGLENAILYCAEEGAKVLNIGMNPQFQAPGRYTWGELTNRPDFVKWRDHILDMWEKENEEITLEAVEQARQNM